MEEVTESKPFNIVTMDEYSELDHGKIMKTTYLNIANQTEDASKKKGTNVTTTNVFHHLLSDTVILK